MKEKPLISLHTHSFNSLLDGCGSVKRYAKQALDHGHPGLAITDHGNMSSTYDLFTECKKLGLKPILGSEMYVRAEHQEISETELEELERGEDAELEEEKIPEKDSEDEKNRMEAAKKFERKNYHQIVLVKNAQGYKNACKLNYYSFLKPADPGYRQDLGGFYYRPRISRQHLFDAHEGLIVTSTCMASEINRNIMDGNAKRALELIEEYKKIFGEDFYIELQINEVDEPEASQKFINSELIKYAKALNIKMVMTGDTHYNNAGDGELQDAMIAVARHSTINDPKAFKIHARNLYYLTRSDYYRLNEEFGYGYDNGFIDECLDNTMEIYDKVDFEFEKKKNYPQFYKGDEKRGKKHLLDLILESAKAYFIKKKFDKQKISEYTARIKYEYEIISKNGYVDYFLVVWDIIRFCRESAIQTGVGRGSVGSSLIAFLLGITGLDPLKYNLFFERFVNPDAISEPDIDLDFDSKRRNEVIEYIKSKWGHDCVVRIGNYNTFRVKGAIRDLARVLERSREDVNFICENIPEDRSASNIDEWFIQFKGELDAKERRIYQWYLANNDIIEWFKKIDEEVRHIGVHAGGVLITPEPIWNFIPVNRTGDTVVSGYAEAGGSVAKEGMIERSAHKNLSELGLLKLDILGLNTVTLIRETVELIQKNKNKDISESVYDLDVENPKLYEEFAKGDNFLIFQFESPGISDLVRRSKPSTFHEVAAINSLYRPAALNSGAANQFAKVCSGQEPPLKIHPVIDGILESTGNVIAFQEQVSRIINACTGIPLGRSEKIRKSIMDRDIGKYPEELKFFLENFVPMSVKHGVDEKSATMIRDYLYDMSGYAFNSSHSFSYAYLAMQTLWLKMNYPQEFYCVSLSNSDNEGMFFQYISDAAKHDITIMPPCVLTSVEDFSPVDDDKISTGLSVLKGLGPKAIKELIENREPWTNIVDFLLEPWKKLNKAGIEALIMSGALSKIESHTRVAMELAKYHFTHKAHLGKLDRKKNVKYSAEMLKAKHQELLNSRMIDYGETELDKLWKKVTGFNYPFRDKFIKYVAQFGARNIVGVSSYAPDKKLVYGEILNVEERMTKTNKPFFRVKITDGFGESIFKIWENHMRINKEIKGGLLEGNLVVVELDKDDFGFTMTRNAKFMTLH